MKRIIITGANGFIGSNMVKWFEEKKDFEPVALVRKNANLLRLKTTSAPITTYPEGEKLIGVLKNTIAVINTAGKASYKGDFKDFYLSNVRFPLDLIKASIEAGVKKFIHISSTVIYGFNGNINTAEEKEPDPYRNPYCITKKICEDKLLEYSNSIKLYILRPATVYGPWDFSFTRSLLSSLEKGLKIFPAGGKTLTSPCYVKNLASAVECAIKNSRTPGIFNISDGNDIRWIDFLTMFSAELNVRPPRYGIPPLPLISIFKILELIEKILKIKLPEAVSSALIAQVRKDYSFNIDRIRNELGYNPPYSTRNGVKESVDWYIEQKSKKPSQVFP